MGLDQFLEGAVTVDRDERVRRTLAVTGRFRSGHRDTSVAHDRVLAAALRP